MDSYKRFREYKFDDNHIFIWFSSFGRVGSRKNFCDLFYALNHKYGSYHYISSYSEYKKNLRFISIYQ